MAKSVKKVTGGPAIVTPSAPKRKAEKKPRKNPTNTDPFAPEDKTIEEVKSLYKKYSSCFLPKFQMTFHLGDYAFFRPPNKCSTTVHTNEFMGNYRKLSSGGENYWVGKIMDIYAVNEKDVYLHVNWVFISTAELQVAKCFNAPKVLHGNEVILSKLSDVVPVQSLEDAANVFEYNETLPIHTHIPAEDMFYRMILNDNLVTPAAATPRNGKRRGNAWSVTSKKGSKQQWRKLMPIAKTSCCFCNGDYTPFDHEQVGMVFCTHGCGTWSHLHCCVQRGINDTDLHVIQTSGVTHVTNEILENLICDVIVPASASDPPPSSQMFQPSQASQGSIRSYSHADHHLSGGLSTQEFNRLMHAAQSPVIRGTSESGLVGTGARVLVARKIVYLTDTDVERRTEGETKAAMKEVQKLLKWWSKQEVEIWGGQDMLLGEEDELEGRKEVYECPRCHNPL